MIVIEFHQAQRPYPEIRERPGALAPVAPGSQHDLHGSLRAAQLRDRRDVCVVALHLELSAFRGIMRRV